MAEYGLKKKRENLNDEQRVGTRRDVITLKVSELPINELLVFKPV